jgi:hypothetical protein
MPGAGFRVAFRAPKGEMSARYPCLPLGLTRLTHDRGPRSRRQGRRHQAVKIGNLFDLSGSTNAEQLSLKR